MCAQNHTNRIFCGKLHRFLLASQMEKERKERNFGTNFDILEAELHCISEHDTKRIHQSIPPNYLVSLKVSTAKIQIFNSGIYL